MTVLVFIALYLYGTISIFSIIGTFLYTHAYIKMKRTYIIGATALLLSAISVDMTACMGLSYYYLIYTNGAFPNSTPVIISLIITKCFLAFSIITFIKATVRCDQ